MEQFINKRILSFDDMLKKVEEFKSAGKTVVQSHGIYDLIHPGIIKHLNEAKKQGDVLIVTVIKDKDVRRGQGRPIFPEKFRAENVASLSQVDYVCLVNDDIPFECVKRLEPDFFAKGQAYKERDQKINDRLFKEEKEIYFGKSKIIETEGFHFSSSQIINNFINIYPEETKSFFRSFSKKYKFDYISEKLHNLKDLKVLLIGDGIIDEYYYCESMGKSPKAQLIVYKYLTHEIFAGGAFAIANHVANLCNNVHLVTLLGKDNSMEDFVSSSLKPNIRTKYFYRDDGPTIVKRRYINQYQNQKTFEINYLNDKHINSDCYKDFIDYIKSVIADFDLILISDFGHGFITDRVIKELAKYSNKIAVNAQTNGANAGYNLITKYKKTNYICLDAPEARLATQNKHGEIEYVARKILKSINTEHLMITLGGNGSICMRRDGTVNRTPAFASKVIDVIGAGDAYFSYTAPCFASGLPMDFVSFIGNAVGALAVQIIGNKKPVEKYELLEFIHAILK